MASRLENDAQGAKLAPSPVSAAKELALEFAADAAAASTAAVLVTPVCAAVDKAVAESLAGVRPLWDSFFASLQSMVREPAGLIRRPEMRYVSALFAGTYLLNNVMVSAEGRARQPMPTTKTATIFAGNLSLAMWKDAAFARLFGGGAPIVPPPAFAAWAARDIVGMTAIFTLPPLVAPRVAEATGISHRSAEALSQFVLPLAVQPIVAPFHQVGYLLSFKPNAAPSELFASVRRELSNVVAARWVRIFPPYCVGATANKDIRMHLRDAFQLPRHGPGRRMTPGLMRRMTPG